MVALGVSFRDFFVDDAARYGHFVIRKAFIHEHRDRFFDNSDGRMDDVERNREGNP